MIVKFENWLMIKKDRNDSVKEFVNIIDFLDWGATKVNFNLKYLKENNDTNKSHFCAVILKIKGLGQNILEIGGFLVWHKDQTEIWIEKYMQKTLEPTF